MLQKGCNSGAVVGGRPDEGKKGQGLISVMSFIGFTVIIKKNKEGICFVKIKITIS